MCGCQPVTILDAISLAISTLLGNTKLFAHIGILSRPHMPPPIVLKLERPTESSPYLLRV
jgi:hypothetical protein